MRRLPVAQLQLVFFRSSPADHFPSHISNNRKYSPLHPPRMTTPTPLQASTLRDWVLSKSTEAGKEPKPNIPRHFKIVDVRDDDYIGGNIPGALNVPSRQMSSRVEELVEELKDLEAVVFTCALSQQRGPNVRRTLCYLLIEGRSKVFESSEC